VPATHLRSEPGYRRHVTRTRCWFVCIALWRSPVRPPVTEYQLQSSHSAERKTVISSAAVKWSPLLLRMLEVPGFKLHLGTLYPDGDFLPILRSNTGLGPETGRSCLGSCLAQFRINNSVGYTIRIYATCS
jgi:hypothetical protein